MGKKIENYILQTIVGSGQFGKVYKAFNQKTNQTVAIKVIQIQKFRLSPKLQQFTLNEINTLTKIQDSTHIVKFIEILKTANNYYFVYEFCNQGTLQQKIKSQGKFSQDKALQYFGQLIKAFKMLVKNNIMHRDIKPSNILLNNGIIKLADFGFCKPMKDSKDLAQTMLGSPIYMAPQILKGQIYTMKADIWSLGVVLYEMLYGFCPFEQRSIARLINVIDQGTVTFPSSVKISKHTQQLLKKMLVKDQFKRIQWKQLFDFNSSANKPNNNNIGFENSRPSLGLIEEQKGYKSSSVKKQGQVNIYPNIPSQTSPQITINNPFTKKHFQSVNNNNIHVNQFTNNNNHQVSANNNYSDPNQTEKQRQRQRDRQRQRRYLQPIKNDYSNRNNSQNRRNVVNPPQHDHSEKHIAERGISQQKQRRRSNTVHDIRQATNQKQKQNLIYYQSNSNNIIQNISLGPSQSPNHPLSMKKTKSTTTSSPSISDVQKKIIQNILEKRQKILKGIKMIQTFLSQSSTKINVNICCLIARKIKSICIQTQDTVKKYIKQIEYKNKNKQNNNGYSNHVSNQVQKSFLLIQQQIRLIKQKLQPFELQLNQVHEPQQIIFLRYGQEEQLTQEKQGLSQLLMIDDYLNITVQKNTPTNTQQTLSNNYNANTPSYQISTYEQKNLTANVYYQNQTQNQNEKSSSWYLQQNYSIKTKKQLLQEYERRILRNEC